MLVDENVSRHKVVTGVCFSKQNARRVRSPAAALVGLPIRLDYPKGKGRRGRGVGGERLEKLVYEFKRLVQVSSIKYRMSVALAAVDVS